MLVTETKTPFIGGLSTTPTTPKWCAIWPATAQPVEHLHGMQGVRFQPSIALLQVDFFGTAPSIETERVGFEPTSSSARAGRTSRLKAEWSTSGL